MPKFIEQNFPFAQLSVVAERESWRKEIYRPVHYLHKWWARRLGSVFRGILLGACLDETEDFWQHFYGPNNFADITIFDPFMGSGVTLAEAIKLGCKSIGRDINPVASIVCQAAFSQYQLAEVMTTYRTLESSLAPKLQNYFRTHTAEGQEATVLYYFLVKIIPCPACGQQIDLFTRRIFSKHATSKKDPSARSVCPDCGAINFIRFDASQSHCPTCCTTYNPQTGTIKGGKVCCNHCRHKFGLVDQMKHADTPLAVRRYAKMLLTKDGQKQYETINMFDRKLEQEISTEFEGIANTFPLINIEPGYNTNQILKHNYTRWPQFFSDRQLLCIKHTMDEIKTIESPQQKLLFATLFSGTLEFNNLFASFKGEGTGAVRHMFAHHILKPEMMPIEANFWGTSKSSGSFSTLFKSRVQRALAYKATPFELKVNAADSKKISGINQPINVKVVDNFKMLKTSDASVYLSTGDSSMTELPNKSVDLVITDPPFFDNVHYSELADFFYYWLNQLLEIDSSTTTRSKDEVQDTDVEQFTHKLTSVFSECHRILRENGRFIFTYHHSRHEGWTSIHQAIREAGFICTQTYPIKAEMSVSMPLKQAKSPIHLDLILVCQKDSNIRSNQTVKGTIPNILDKAKQQIRMLKNVGIKVSLGDAKVILMGQFLCQAHKLKNLELETQYLQELEDKINAYVEQIILTEGEILYRVRANEFQQLSLFEDMAQYILTRQT